MTNDASGAKGKVTNGGCIATYKPEKQRKGAFRLPLRNKSAKPALHRERGGEKIGTASEKLGEKTLNTKSFCATKLALKRRKRL